MAEQALIEVCVDSVASAVAAQQGGATRIELCSDLIEGGITPSAGLIGVVRARVSIGLQVIIRPRGGDFCYTDEEIEIMRRDIAVAKEEGADGIVLGILDTDGHVDVHRTHQLVELARPLNITFHRAFDMAADLFQSLDDVCATGADRLLTSGGEQTSLQGAETIAALVKLARGRIAIMAGGGIGHLDAAALIERTGVHDIHVGLSTPFPSPMRYRNPRLSIGKVQGLEYERAQVLKESVRSLHSAISLASS